MLDTIWFKIGMQYENFEMNLSKIQKAINWMRFIYKFNDRLDFA